MLYFSGDECTINENSSNKDANISKTELNKS